MNSNPPLSVIIICKNEEKNIDRCLKSLQFAKEVILVDSGSTDKTLEIAKNFPNVKVFSIDWRGFVGNKKFAVTQTSFDWILWIDADEVVTNDLANEWLNKSLLELENVAAISISRKTFFLNNWVKYSGWYPDHILRFFNKNRAQFNDKVLHEGLIFPEQYVALHFKSFLLHYSYTSLFQYFLKMNQYGLAGAKELQRRGKKVYFFQIVTNPLWSFIKFYFFKRGFLDGLIGFIICAGAAFSNFIKYSNYFFLKKYGYVENTPE